MSTRENYSVAGAGLLALDVIVAPDGSFVNSAIGGSVCNVLAILSSFGWHVVPIGIIGQDGPGDMLIEGFKHYGAETRFVRRNRECTPIVYQHPVIHQGRTTHRFSLGCPRCGRRCVPHVRPESNRFPANLEPSSAFFLIVPRLSPLNSQNITREAAHL